MTRPSEPTDLEASVVAVYRGPLEEFISRRDALVKELRAAKRREDADRIKALRKPSRTAWVLDGVVHEDPTVLDQLSAAITAAQTVNSGAELRSAMESVRTAIRDVAAAGARVAIRAGQPVDASTLVTAVHAVIGETSAFSDLRAGRLVDVPAGGGLDILAAITINVPEPSSSAPTPPSPAANAPASPNADRSAEVAERATQQAARAAQEAERAIAAARADVQRAEAALAHAHAEAKTRSAELERARRDAEVAADRVRDAERAVATARAHLTSTTADTPNE